MRCLEDAFCCPDLRVHTDLRRRARKLATDSRVDPRTRSLIRYGLKIKDEYLEQVVNRVESGEMSIDHIRFDSD